MYVADVSDNLAGEVGVGQKSSNTLMLKQYV